MKLIISLLLITFFLVSTSNAQVKEITRGELVFQTLNDSKILGKTTTFKSKINLDLKTLEMVIPVSSFKFNSEKHENQFLSNENLNSKGFPEIVIKATISSASQITSNKRNIVTIEGDAEVKGKSYHFKTNGLLVNDKNITLTTMFSVNGSKIGLNGNDFDKLELSVDLNY